MPRLPRDAAADASCSSIAAYAIDAAAIAAPWRHGDISLMPCHVMFRVFHYADTLRHAAAVSSAPCCCHL